MKKYSCCISRENCKKKTEQRQIVLFVESQEYLNKQKPDRASDIGKSIV